MDSESQPIPRHIFRPPEYARQCQLLVQHVSWHAPHPYQRRQEHKRLMREAARRVRDSFVKHGALDNDSKLLILRSVARAVWRDDIILAE
eukprot:8683366-Pyramimonas_sp.AAC.1